MHLQNVAISLAMGIKVGLVGQPHREPYINAIESFNLWFNETVTFSPSHYLLAVKWQDDSCFYKYCDTDRENRTDVLNFTTSQGFFMPNLHCKGGTEVLLKWHLHVGVFTDCIMLFRGGINAFTKQLLLYTLILGVKVDQRRQK